MSQPDPLPRPIARRAKCPHCDGVVGPDAPTHACADRDRWSWGERVQLRRLWEDWCPGITYTRSDVSVQQMGRL